MAPQNHQTEIAPYGKAAIEHASRLIAEGQPVAVPTETVYGLAADATSQEAVERVFEAKGRPAFNPLIVHVADLASAERLAHFTEPARAAALAWWPGALTLVLPLREDSGIAPEVTAGLGTIALRCPAHKAMQDLLRACGRPLAAPSANASGTVSPTCADHVLKSLDGRIRLIVDGGRAALGVESTIVAFTDGVVRLLRPGPVPFDDVAALASLAEGQREDRIEAPGQMRNHYSPAKPLRIDAPSAEADEWMIGFGPVKGNDTLSASGSLEEAAARLFACLHRADLQSRSRIAVAPVPRGGIGEAINDRLARAAAPRPETELSRPA
ncbi:L-threonylcarbamoyladenylate synthase [Allosphingosinicella sp.]|uniref:L-threonylcarbamoyladenylate synthase n=1 Tax=Allosphingosinicella sp. TaxID=2823234 RepID=UPI002F191E43